MKTLRYIIFVYVLYLNMDLFFLNKYVPREQLYQKKILTLMVYKY
jgi:hypothetical protein